MPTRNEALDELQLVFEMIADEFRARGEARALENAEIRWRAPHD